MTFNAVMFPKKNSRQGVSARDAIFLRDNKFPRATIIPQWPTLLLLFNNKMFSKGRKARKLYARHVVDSRPMRAGSRQFVVNH